ncbi:SHOCT domain-containing protein [Clostridium sp.]
MDLEWNQQRVTAEIMKYKELLDEGIITEEEFSIKEKELLRKLIK